MTALLTSATALLLAGLSPDAPAGFGPPPGKHLAKRTDQAKTPGTGTGVPVRLGLPAQGVRADIVPVGATRSHHLAVPPDPDDVGWYRFGARPGASSGSAVLVGHVDSRSGTLGTLASLTSVRPGDPVLVSETDGTTDRYRITARRSVAKTAFPSSLFRTSGPPTLVLITCTPPFDADRGGYQRLLIVTARPAPRG